MEEETEFQKIKEDAKCHCATPKLGNYFHNKIESLNKKGECIHLTGHYKICGKCDKIVDPKHYWCPQV
jgi:hypothetical protein